MNRILTLFFLILIPVILQSQQSQIARFLSDSSMSHSSVSLCIIDADSGTIISQYNGGLSLTQASILKLITTAVALEKLGKNYQFKTDAGYTGEISKSRKSLKGDIIIKGGGDPSLGSENFPEYYKDFIDKWVQDFKALGIRKVTGRIIVDDSYFDYEPVPAGWGWDDLGNYYGAGAYGLSIYDNTLQIHFKTGGEGSYPVITSMVPEGSGIELKNYLTSSGSTDNGYIYLAPYTNTGWISGTIPVDKEDFILKGSIPDPPLFLANAFYKKLKYAGIKVKGTPFTGRVLPILKTDNFISVSQTLSPPLSAIIDVLIHKSVNLYAEHLIKQLGKVCKNSGTTLAGTEVIKQFLDSAGINTKGMFIEDGSGLSTRDAVNSSEMTKLLLFMKNKSRYFDDYFSSLPEAGKNGTLKNYFKDQVFDSRLRAKSGSLTRVRSFAGYFKTISGKDMIFCIIVNNYNGPSRGIISGIEEILKEIILTR
jgi:D-alanyl-D-alanine carboxypeptidase/D-alanyl-D-alanine-endopeptidase (penicillin-binding protein 4)